MKVSCISFIKLVFSRTVHLLGTARLRAGYIFTMDFKVLIDARFTGTAEIPT